jgi:hypothetical protein
LPRGLQSSLLFGGSAPPDLAEDGHEDPHPAQHSGDGSVGRLDLSRGARDAQPETTIDYTHRDQDPAVPQVEMGPDLSPVKLLELRVVDEAKDRLEAEGRKYHEADDGVVVDRADIQLDKLGTGKQKVIKPGSEGWGTELDWVLLPTRLPPATGMRTSWIKEIPRPTAATNKMKATTCVMACSHSADRPGTSRMATAPTGNRMTKAVAARIPWAVR